MKANVLFVRAAVFFVLFTQVHAGQYFQDFSGSTDGTTSFTDGSQLFSTHLGSVAKVTDNTFRELQLTATGTTGTRSAFMLPDLDESKAVTAFSAKWSAPVYGDFPNAADGLSFNFGQLGSLNLTNGVYNQESGFGVGLSFDVQTYADGNPGFFLRVNGNIIASLTNNPTLQWGVNSDRRHFFEVDWNYLSGITVRMNNQTIFANVPTPQFSPSPGDRFVWAARCGGQTEYIRLDNIIVMTGGNLVEIPSSSPYYGDENGSVHPKSFAFDGDDSTFWRKLSVGAGEIGATYSPAHTVAVYALTSINQASRSNDPLKWALEGSNDEGGNWSVLATNQVRFMNPMETRAFPATNVADFGAYRLNASATASNPFAVAVGELRLYSLSTLHATVLPWKNATVPNQPYNKIAASSDLRVIASALDWGRTGSIMISTNWGETWFAGDLPVTNWTCVAVSADGSKMVAGMSRLQSGMKVQGHLWVSTNSGVNWTDTQALASWNSLAMSADGNTIIGGCVFYEPVYISTNFGASFSPTSLPNGNWESIACSTDATKIIAAQKSWPYGSFPQTNGVYVSTNSGANWTQTSLPTYNGNWPSVASSANGRIFAAAGSYEGTNHGVYLSFDSGATWQQSLPDLHAWRGVALSADGRKIVAVNDHFGEGSDLAGEIYVSSDFGGSWQFVPNKKGVWKGAVSSADGNRLAASEANRENGSISLSYFPGLDISRTNDSAFLSWTANQRGFVLQQNTNLATGNWIDVPTNGISVAGEQYQLTTPTSTGNKFFRLKAQ